jgi:mRNA interferase MazF
VSTTRRRRFAKPGDVLLAQIPENVPPGNEQQGTRPVVVVATPSHLGPQRFAALVIVPMTKTTGSWAESNPTLYPRLEAGQGGLPSSSTAMIDHVQAIDATRVLKQYGTLEDETFNLIKTGLQKMFAFEAPTS